MASSSSRGRELRQTVIEGLKIQMTAAELGRRLTERIAWHTASARELDEDLQRPESDRRDRLTPEHIVEHDMLEHEEQAEVLTLLRDHLIQGEVYCLSETDLRFADLTPDIYATPRRRRAPASAGEPRVELPDGAAQDALAPSA
jgi:hypothetical protein